MRTILRNASNGRLFSRYLGLLVLVLSLGFGIFSEAFAQLSVARRWDEAMLEAIRRDTPRPTVHARNLFHTSVAMYDAWASFDPIAKGYVTDEKSVSGNTLASRNEAISYAAYNVLKSRFANSAGAAATLPNLDNLMVQLGYDPANMSTQGNSASALGNRIAQNVLSYGLADGSNEANNYRDTSGYMPQNGPLIIKLPGTQAMSNPNHWQPLAFDFALTQNGIVADLIQTSITPHWNSVLPFAMHKNSPADLYHDPGPQPQLGGVGDAQFRQEVMDVIRFSSRVNANSGRMIDISPGAYGNNPLGTNVGTGHALNPVTHQPYASRVVKEGDFGRVLAEFWADGPRSETPPGHWNVIANGVSDTVGFEKRIGGTGPVVDDLEWDVKTYFALNGAVHDAGVTAWGIRCAYDGARPISMIRYMGEKGQSSDPLQPSYDPNGLPLEPGLVEVIPAGLVDPTHPLFNLRDFAGQIAIHTWPGQPADPATEVGGTEWILASKWVPFQQSTFVTPAFPGYISGHSTFSRSAAEVLTSLTGSEYFPGGLEEYTIPAGGLDFELGPTQDITLGWATYYDAADQAGQSRLWGGIHVSVDDLTGRTLGSQVGRDAYALASSYYSGVPEPASAFAVGSMLMLLVLRRRIVA